MLISSNRGGGKSKSSRFTNQMKKS